MAHRFGVLAALALLITTTTGVTLANPSRSEARPAEPGGRVIAVAHRGASAYAPENTLPAVRLGQAQNADLVEVDVHQTRDDVLVVMHDGTLARTTNAETVYPDRGPWRIADFTYAEIRRLDAGSWFGGEYAGTPVPTLDEVLDTLEEDAAGLLLEVKSPSRYPGIGQRVAAHLTRRAPEWAVEGREMLVCSFDWGFVADFSRLMPAVRVAVIGTPGYSDLPAVARYADLVNPEFGTVDAAYLARAHELGMESYGWTVDDPDDMRTLIEIGSDGVVTNRPDVLDEVLNPSRTTVA